jgi:hypothetical protein
LNNKTSETIKLFVKNFELIWVTLVKLCCIY